jgi:hypothetical protein
MTEKLERGCDPNWTCGPCKAVNFDIRQQCRFCRKPRAEVERAESALNRDRLS